VTLYIKYSRALNFENVWQEELWQSTRHVATALAGECAAADAARRETLNEHDQVQKLQARMDLMREAMRLRDQDEKHDAMEDRLRLNAAEAAAQESAEQRRLLQDQVHKLEEQLRYVSLASILVCFAMV